MSVAQGVPVKGASSSGTESSKGSPGVVEGIPLYENFDNPMTSKFVVQGCKDVWAAVLFILCVIMTVIWGIANYSDNLQNVNNDMKNETATHHHKKHNEDKGEVSGGELVGYLFVLVLVSSAAAIMSLLAIGKWPRQAIIVANVAAGVIMIVAGIAAITVSIFTGVVLILFGLLQLVWLYLVRDRIPFAALLLNISTGLVKRYKAMVGANLGLIGIFTIFLIFFSSMAYPASRRASRDEAKGADGALICLFLLIFFWASQVTINIGHVTSSGVVATWYFVGAGQMPPNPTAASFKRASTTSLGSICFGSLLVAILRLLRTLAKWSRDEDNSIVACILECILGVLERLMEYFNVYAFVHVAIYGCGYVEAAKRTWALAKQCVFAALFNDCLIGPTLSLTALAVSMLVGVVTGIATSNAAIGFLAFFICFSCHILVFRAVESSVVTMFVCFAEAPAALAQSSPELYAAINAANAGQNVV